MTADENRRLSKSDILAQLPAARARAEQKRVQGGQAVHVQFDHKRRELRFSFANGASIGIPVTMISALEGATLRELNEVEVSPSGTTVHFESLDVDLSIPALIGLAFKGTVATKALSAIAGGTSSERKSAAARANGKLGGRPRKRSSDSSSSGAKKR